MRVLVSRSIKNRTHLRRPTQIKTNPWASSLWCDLLFCLAWFIIFHPKTRKNLIYSMVRLCIQVWFMLRTKTISFPKNTPIIPASIFGTSRTTMAPIKTPYASMIVALQTRIKTQNTYLPYIKTAWYTHKTHDLIPWPLSIHAAFPSTNQKTLPALCMAHE